MPAKTTRLWSFAPSLQIEIGVQPASRTIVSNWAMSAIACAKSLALSALSSGGVEGRVLPWLRLGRRDGRQIPRYAQLAPNWRRQKPRDGFEHEVWLIATRNQAEAAPRPVELDWRSIAIWHSRLQTLGGARLPWRSATGVVRRRRRQPTGAAIDAGPAPWRGTQGATGASPVPPAPSSPYH